MSDFYTTTALMPNGDSEKINLENYHGSYVLLIFYPGDFNPLSKNTMLDFAKNYEKFVVNGCQVILISLISVRPRFALCSIQKSKLHVWIQALSNSRLQYPNV